MPECTVPSARRVPFPTERRGISLGKSHIARRRASEETIRSEKMRITGGRGKNGERRDAHPQRPLE